MAVDSGSSSDSSSDLLSEGSLISAINVTPFVDVVLVLLVIFMITAPALVKESLDIKLPKTESSDGLKANTFGVAINRDGNILIDGIISDESGLIEKVKNELKKDLKTQVLITADDDVNYGRVVKVIDLIKSSGLEKFAVQIEKKK